MCTMSNPAAYPRRRRGRGLRWAVIALQQGDRHDSGAERSLHLALTGRIADTLEYRLLQMTAPEAA